MMLAGKICLESASDWVCCAVDSEWPVATDTATPQRAYRDSGRVGMPQPG
jgi:hypothetical protein